jgi:hypothetical protein
MYVLLNLKNFKKLEDMYCENNKQNRIRYYVQLMRTTL